MNETEDKRGNSVFYFLETAEKSRVYKSTTANNVSNVGVLKQKLRERLANIFEVEGSTL